jgi:hypothetical protein
MRRHPVCLSSVSEELVDSARSVVVAGLQASDEPRVAIDESVKDKFPVNKTFDRSFIVRFNMRQS